MFAQEDHSSLLRKFVSFYNIGPWNLIHLKNLLTKYSKLSWVMHSIKRYGTQENGTLQNNTKPNNIFQSNTQQNSID